MSKKYYYLPFKALGDFVITTAIIKKNFGDKIPILLTSYLKDLFYELEADKYYDVKGHINFPKYPKLFELHKIKKFDDVVSFIKDYLIIASQDKAMEYVVDTHCKRLVFTGLKFKHPEKEGNVYDTRLRLLSQTFNLKINVDDIDKQNSPISSIVIFPGSRMKSKEIEYTIAREIQEYFTAKNLNIKIAYHINEIPIGHPEGSYITFTNFNELKKLIEISDFVMSADSLPIHFSYYLNKPHYCLYNKVANTTWLTPSALKNNFFSVINDQKSYGEEIYRKMEDHQYFETISV